MGKGMGRMESLEDHMEVEGLGQGWGICMEVGKAVP